MHSTPAVPLPFQVVQQNELQIIRSRRFWLQSTWLITETAARIYELLQNEHGCDQLRTAVGCGITQYQGHIDAVMNCVNSLERKNIRELMEPPKYVLTEIVRQLEVVLEAAVVNTKTRQSVADQIQVLKDFRYALRQYIAWRQIDEELKEVIGAVSAALKALPRRWFSLTEEAEKVNAELSGYAFSVHALLNQWFTCSFDELIKSRDASQSKMVAFSTSVDKMRLELEKRSNSHAKAVCLENVKHILERAGLINSHSDPSFGLWSPLVEILEKIGHATVLLIAKLKEKAVPEEHSGVERVHPRVAHQKPNGKQSKSANATNDQTLQVANPEKQGAQENGLPIGSRKNSSHSDLEKLQELHSGIEAIAKALSAHALLTNVSRFKAIVDEAIKSVNAFTSDFSAATIDALSSECVELRDNGFQLFGHAAGLLEEMLLVADAGMRASGQDRDSLNQPLNQQQIGLAFSGGGIRSATFNLGVLQGLAEQRLLTSFDYLSTVSGGGYIGGWLAAWIKRDGDIRNVEKLLIPSRGKQAEAFYSSVVHGSANGVVHEAEPEPIRHLRAYSNYLAPRPGVFSSDSWTLIATYLRNLFLNQLVIIPTCIGVLTAMLVLCWLQIDSQRRVNNFAMVGWLSFGLVIFIGCCVHVYTILVELRGKQRTLDESSTASSRSARGVPIFSWSISTSESNSGTAMRLTFRVLVGVAMFLGIVRMCLSGPQENSLPMLAWGVFILGLCFVVSKWTKKEGRSDPLLDLLCAVLIAFVWLVSEHVMPSLACVGFIGLASLFATAFMMSLFQSRHLKSKSSNTESSQPAGNESQSVDKAAKPVDNATAANASSPAANTTTSSGIDHRTASLLAAALTFCAFLLNLGICAADKLPSIKKLTNVKPESVAQILFSTSQDLSDLNKTVVLYTHPLVPFLICGALLHMLFNLEAIRDLVFGKYRTTLASLRWLFSGLAAGAAGGFVLFGYLKWLSVSTWFKGSTEIQIILGPPIILLAVFLVETIQVGLPGPLEDEAVREWWSAFLAKILIAMAAWLSLFTLVLLCPKLLFLPGHEWAGLTAIVGWVATALGTLSSAHSPKTGGEGKINAMDILVLLGPPVFLSGLLVALSAGTYLLVTGQMGGVDLTHLDWMEALSIIGPNDWKSFYGHHGSVLGSALAIAAVGLAASRLVDVNVFSLQHMYANRLIRCYLGASHQVTDSTSQDKPRIRSWQTGRSPDRLTGFDNSDDLRLTSLQFAPPPEGIDPANWKAHWKRYYTGPIHLINTAVNLVKSNNLAWQERLADSFVLTPYHCGSGTTGFCVTGRKSPGVDVPDDYDGTFSLGKAVSLSGAAVSPNMGYYSSPAVGALLTVFNLRLGAWLGNPKCPDQVTPMSSPKNGWIHLARESVGDTSEDSKFVYLSDGGHFDNLGVYELVRRRCKIIVACDAGADPTSGCFELAVLIRNVRVDFGIEIEIDTERLELGEKNGPSQGHVAVGRIRYSQLRYPPILEDEADKIDGYLIYIKPTLTGDETADILSYKKKHHRFPHDSTLNQFFSESQFESYRQLGYHIAADIFCDDQRRGAKLPREKSHLDQHKFFEGIYQKFKPSPSPDYLMKYVQLNQSYVDIHKSISSSPQLAKFSMELRQIALYLDQNPSKEASRQDTQQGLPLKAVLKYRNMHRNSAEFIAERETLIQMFTILENVFFSLGLTRYDQSTNNGWIQVVRLWIMTRNYQDNWRSIRKEFSSEFQQYCEQFQEAISRDNPPFDA